MNKKNHIIEFFHCGNCMKDKPDNASPSDWSRIECGFTKEGLQVRCIRCNLNIINLDFLGQKVHAV